MQWMREVWRRFTFFFRRGQFQRELREEMDEHVRMKQKDLTGEGMPPDEARSAARREFGNALLLREKSRDAWGFRWLETLLQDLRYGLRQLRRHPGFTAVAVITLALGIGANTAIFSAIQAVMLSVLPVKDPGQLVVLKWNSESWPRRVSETGMTSSEAFSYQSFELFSELGSADFVPSKSAAFSKGCAEKPQSFQKRETLRYLFVPDIWIPFTARPGIGPWGSTPRAGQNVFTSRYWFCLSVMACLRPGVTRAQARAMAADTVFRNFFTGGQNPPAKLADLPHIELASGAKGMDWIRQILGEPLLILMAGVGLVLLIACANVAALLLGRVAARQREIGMRVSLGASRGRLIRQLLTESVLLAFVGGVAGVAFAFWLTRGLETLISSGSFPITIGIQINVPVLGFTAAVAVGTGIAFGLAPAWRASRVELTSALKEKSSGSGTPSRMALGNFLVIAQVAVCLLLLIGAGLFVRTLDNVENQNLGFEQQGLLLFGVNPTQDGYKGERLISLYDVLLRRLQALPSVQGATSYEYAPFSGWSNNNDIHIEGYTRKLDSMTVKNATVGPDFFKIMGIHVLLGRGIRWRDTGSAPKVAVVTQAMAKYFFGNVNPIGRQFNIGDNPDPKNTFRIVGVVENVKLTKLVPGEPDAAREVFVPFAQAMDLLGSMYFEVRTAGNPTALVPAVRRVVSDLDARLPLSNVKTQVEQTRQAAMEQKLFAEISSLFGLLALLLACVGLYGTMSYAVARRTNEIGIRMALGAQRGQVLRMVLREALGLTGIGIAIGVPVAFVLMRLVSSQLYGLKPTDPLTIAGAASLLAIIALFAGYIPARRATKVDPMIALRYE